MKGVLLYLVVPCVLAVAGLRLWRHLHRVPGQCGGIVHQVFTEVKDTFCRNVASGVEPGASFAVYHQGRPLVKLWGGHADPGAEHAWTEDTLTQAWSCTKGVTAVVMAMLVDRGLIDYNKPVHSYWPEFAANGKDNITVAMLLSHQAGLMHVGRTLSLWEYRDNWQEVEDLLAQQTPLWKPGTCCAYHALTYGMYADALVRKVDPQHRNISQFFREEIAIPFDLDFYIGLPPDQYFRSTKATYTTLNAIFVSKFLLSPRMWRWLPEVLLAPMHFQSVHVFDFLDDLDSMNEAELRSIGLSSSNGFGTAGALAKLFDILANDGVLHGQRLLSREQIAALSTPVRGDIPILATVVEDVRVGMGMVIEKNVLGQPIFGHRGYGGQNVFADPNNKIGVSYITNFNSEFSESDDPRALELLTVLYDSIQRYNDLPDDQK